MGTTLFLKYAIKLLIVYENKLWEEFDRKLDHTKVN